MNKASLFPVAIGLTLASFVIFGVFEVGRLGLTQEFLHVAMLVLGMLTMAALTLIFRATGSPIKSSIISITFNEVAASEQIRTAGEVIDAEIVNEDKREREQRGFSASALVGRDNHLALAKLRMDLEQALSKLARIHSIIGGDIPYNSRKIFDLLVEKGHLPIELASVWREVLSACNKAIHGSPVDNDTAESIVRVGMQMLSIIENSVRKAKSDQE